MVKFACKFFCSTLFLCICPYNASAQLSGDAEVRAIKFWDFISNDIKTISKSPQDDFGSIIMQRENGEICVCPAEENTTFVDDVFGALGDFGAATFAVSRDTAAITVGGGIVVSACAAAGVLGLCSLPFVAGYELIAGDSGEPLDD